MTPPSTPPFPKWFFFAMDAVLLAAAVFVASQSHRPLSNAAVLGIVACAIAGVIIGTIPLLVNYEGEKNAALDKRQEELEALAQTIAAAAGQIGAASGGLHTVADLAQKNLRHAEQLPHKLQDKMAEFQALLANASDTEKEELEKELASLRSSESERLETISDKIAKSTADWAKLEAAAHKNLAAAQDAVTKLDEKMRSTLSAFDAKLAALEKSAVPASAPPAIAREESSGNSSPLPVAAPPSPSASATPPATTHGNLEAVAKTAVVRPPKRPRNSQRDESLSGTSSGLTSASKPGFEVELPPAKLQEILPIAPGTQAPFTGNLLTQIAPAPAAAAAGDATVASVTGTTPPIGTTSPARKRSEKKSPETNPPIAAKENSATPALELELQTAPPRNHAPAPLPAVADSEFTQVSPEEAAPAAAVAADGATRLLVTAYIGIGNRLFIRGSGPGLSWDKGVPLQFVSIGKWRWETADAAAPVKFKLYKNDELECAALGAQALAAGHQQELTAAF